MQIKISVREHQPACTSVGTPVDQETLHAVNPARAAAALGSQLKFCHEVPHDKRSMRVLYRIVRVAELSDTGGVFEIEKAKVRPGAPKPRCLVRYELESDRAQLDEFLMFLMKLVKGLSLAQFDPGSLSYIAAENARLDSWTQAPA